LNRLVATVAALLLAACATAPAPRPSRPEATSLPGAGPSSPRLGNFSISLAVKDLAASRAFYEKLGFRLIGGDQAQRWLILQNDASTIGLFQGAIPQNTLTYNPGWSRSAEPLPDFDDVRDVQRILEGRGIKPTVRADEASAGPAFLMLTDPDGNQILIDQHVARPGK
jgi:catechol 2,3-dioxygenase-like lactoylglutathione lyase family enzyme